MKDRRSDDAVRVRRVGSGYAAEGRSFYVWDAERDVVLRVARELARGNAGIAPTRGTLVVRVRDRVAGSGDPEALDA